MKDLRAKRNLCRLMILCVALFTLAALTSARTPSTSVNIVNNSNKEVRNVYLSHVNLDDWGGNQLGDATILPGQSFTLDNVACDQQQVKVIADRLARSATSVSVQLFGLRKLLRDCVTRKQTQAAENPDS